MGKVCLLHRCIAIFMAVLAIYQPIQAQEVTVPYRQTFDGATTGSPGTLPQFWQQVSEGTTDACNSGNTACYDWAVWTGTTPSTVTGPLGDHTTGSGNYIYVEASGNANDSVIVLSPSFDLGGDNNAVLRFWTHSYNGDNNNDHFLDVDVVNAANTSTLGGALLTIDDTNFNNWQQWTVDLSAYANSGIIRIKFRWELGTADYRLDHCIDDFEITSDYCTEGDNYKDEFASANYNNSNGSISWTTDSWTESDDDGNAATGNIQITGGRVEMNNPGYDSGDQPAITRAVDLTGATFASLSFDYSETGNMETTDRFEVRVFNGTIWTTVFSLYDDFGATEQTAYIDITEFANANTQIRFIITNFYGASDEILRFDNIDICFETDAVITTDFYLETECGYVGSRWFTDSDGNASNDAYVEPREGLNSLTSAPADTSSYLTYEITIDSAGSYEIYGRIIATSDTTDSYWIRANGGTWFKWDSLSVNSSWTWLQVDDSDQDTLLSFNLSVGTNRIDIAYREEGAQIDKIFITLDGSIPTGEGSAANNCSSLFNTDSDGDGITDNIDIDDDNDGILDVDENPASIDFSGTRTLLVGSSLTNLLVGDKVLYTDAIQDCDDILYDIVITIVTRDGVTLEAEDTGINLVGAEANGDDYATFTIAVVESGSATVGNPNGTSATIVDFVLAQRDVDSNDGSNYTEVVGVTNSGGPDSIWLDGNTLLEEGGFVNGGGPASGFDIYRLDALNGTTNWTNNGGSATEDDENAVFMLFNNFSTVELLFGATGSTGTLGTRFTRLTATKDCDRDGDGIPNRIDLDVDNDGIFDLYEAGHAELDLNDDGRIDSADVYSGSNGLYDSLETSIESGVLNYTYDDTDNDGINDYSDLDSDGDGCFDTEEADVSDNDVDGVAGSGTPSVDISGLVISIVYDIPPDGSWQDATAGCLEICDNGIDDDGDGDIDENDSDCANYYLEAECGFPGDNWDRGMDVLASNNDYLTISPGLNSLDVAPSAAADLVRFTVNVTATGLYRVLGRVWSADGADDSFWFRVDEGTWYKWNDWNTASTWQWIAFSNNDDGNTLVKYTLTPGNHTIDIAYREDGARIDKLHLTVNGTTPTGEGEDAINCGRTITYNLFLPYKILNK